MALLILFPLLAMFGALIVCGAILVQKSFAVEREIWSFKQGENFTEANEGDLETKIKQTQIK